MSAPHSLLSPERGLYALLITPATLHAGTVPDLLDLELPAGLWRRARVGRRVSSHTSAPTGRGQVILHLRTDQAGRLKNPLSLIALEPVGMDTPVARWEVLGQVVNLDLAQGLLTVRVLPRARVKPFLLLLHLPLDASWNLPKLTRWHFAGQLEGERLLLEQVWAPDALPSGGEQP